MPADRFGNQAVEMGEISSPSFDIAGRPLIYVQSIRVSLPRRATNPLVEVTIDFPAIAVYRS